MSLNFFVHCIKLNTYICDCFTQTKNKTRHEKAIISFSFSRTDRNGLCWTTSQVR